MCSLTVSVHTLPRERREAVSDPAVARSSLSVTHRASPRNANNGRGHGGRTRPRVYLAAPYTSRATERTSDEGTVVADQLPAGPYRATLTRLADTIAAWGVEVVLPHRDISHWGASHLSPGKIAKACTERVLSCQLVVALLATSFGTHVEVGVAIGADIPVIALWPNRSEASFFASGLVDSGLVTRLTVASDAHLPELPSVEGLRAHAVRSAVADLLERPAVDAK